MQTNEDLRKSNVMYMDATKAAEAAYVAKTTFLENIRFVFLPRLFHKQVADFSCLHAQPRTSDPTDWYVRASSIFSIRAKVVQAANLHVVRDYRLCRDAACGEAERGAGLSRICLHFD
jgi:hypothetical protein